MPDTFTKAASAKQPRKQPPRRPWWTAADQAELDVLTHEFVDGAWEHQERCAVCSQGGPWCKPLREALDVVLEFQQARDRMSKAQWLRAQQG